jgi:pimeloyl-ACP methyl ester carboxylesterase
MNENDRYIFIQACIYIACFLLLVEIAFFFVVYYHLLPSLQKLTRPHAFPTNTVEFMKRILDSVSEIKCYTFEQYIAGFFRGAKFEDVRQENFKSFLAWAMFGKHVKDLTPKNLLDIQEISDYAQLKHPAARRVKPGFNPNIKHCSMTLEPIPTIHRPLMTYVIVALTEALANLIFLRMRGFRSLEVDGMTYWYRKHSGSSGAEGPDARNSLTSAGDEPVVFLHGISTGWMLYLQLARALSRNRTLILIDVDAIKIKSMTFVMPTPQQFVEKFRKLLDRHHIPRAAVVGHSFGSITAGWLASRCPERLSHLTLLDPVSMLLAFPEVSYSFLYRVPEKLTEWIIYLMASRELTISHTLHRHFWWYNNNLWLEDVPHNIGVVIGLATHDEIINPAAVQEYVCNCAAKREFGMPRAEGAPEIPVASIECLIFDGYTHGQILLPTPTQSGLVTAVKLNEKAGAKLLSAQEKSEAEEAKRPET